MKLGTFLKMQCCKVTQREIELLKTRNMLLVNHATAFRSRTLLTDWLARSSAVIHALKMPCLIGRPCYLVAVLVQLFNCSYLKPKCCANGQRAIKKFVQTAAVTHFLSA